MKKIMLCCSAGMSTSMLVKKMEEEAKKRDLAVEIMAYGSSEFNSHVADYQVVLLGPQIRYMKNDFQKIADQYGIKVEPINMQDYGLQRGDNVLDFALSLIEE
jgi:PTS system cellobiose-specific IIB component